MASIQDMDFANFLDIGDLDLASFSPLGQDHHGERADGTQPSHQMGNAESQLFSTDPMMHDFGADQFELPMPMDQEQILQPNTNYMLHDNHDFSDHANNQSWPSQQQQTQNAQSHLYQPPQHVPPTPNSYDMQGSAAHFLHQQMDPQARAFLEQRYQLRKDDTAMAFTPLVSPAVTPQDSHFQTLPEFTIPGAYFSPLTSPALQAQNASQHQHQMLSYHTNPSTAGSSLATSPIDLSGDVDMAGHNSAAPEPARRTRRKTQAPRSAGPAARVRQSPIVKAQQKRKSSHLSTVIQPKDVDDLLQHATSHSNPASLLRTAPTTDRSGSDSISPEPLSESVMGPPPRPVSAIQSPALLAHSQSAPASASVNATLGAPATPASLMSLKRARQLNANQTVLTSPHSINTIPQPGEDSPMFDDFSLPPAANDMPQRPLPNRIITDTPISADATPRLAARKTPKLGPSGTVTPSPCISAIASPSIAATPFSLTGRKLEPKTAPRSIKKRGSIGGPLISPAIRPKISPSIKPLLPEGGVYSKCNMLSTSLTCLARMNESQQALLLASKSNYTHILEGTLLPGVTYPESLSSGLTSKRTSHKIAEQGRRNRINDALKEMQALLPQTTPKLKPTNSNGSGGPDKTAGAIEDDDDERLENGKNGASESSKSASSKAATVESAIDYIKLLQQERLQHAQMLKERDAELASLREELQKASLGRADGETVPEAKLVNGNGEAKVDQETEQEMNRGDTDDMQVGVAS